MRISHGGFCRRLWYNTGMESAKPILYGVSDFVLMRTKGAYYLDRTAYIRELENTRYVMFLRPRRFGKSLLVSMLQCQGTAMPSSTRSSPSSRGPTSASWC